MRLALEYAAARLLVGLQDRLLGLFVRVWFRRRPGPPQRLLVFRSSAIGDFVCALPALYRLRQRFPASRITLLTTPTGNPRYWKRIRVGGGRVLASPRLVDEVLFFRSYELLWPSRFLALRRQIQRVNPDLSFLLPFTGEPFWNRLKKIILLRLLGVRWNLRGYEMRSSQGFFRRIQFERGDFSHQVVAALEAVDGAGATTAAGVVFWLDAPGEAVSTVDEVWRQCGLNGRGPVVAVSPGARFEHKRWPLENFLALCRNLLQEFDLRIVAIGGAEEREMCNGLARLCPERIHNLAGETTLLETAEVLRRSALYIGNDSGPAHLAAAVGTRCVTIFSSVVFPGIWEPWGEQNIALRHRVPCEYCLSEGHCPRGTMECIQGITVEQVLTAVKVSLQKDSYPCLEGYGSPTASSFTDD